MPRVRPRLIAAVLLCASLTRAQQSLLPMAQGDTLVWTPPCSFPRANDAAPYDKEVITLLCDYMLGSYKDAVVQFNRLPTLTAQQAHLAYAQDETVASFLNYKAERDKLLKATELGPVMSLPPTLRLKKLMEL